MTLFNLTFNQNIKLIAGLAFPNITNLINVERKSKSHFYETTNYHVKY
jgi:hypothetical protein